MNKEFRLPDVGEGLTEADIVSWHVKPGDTVEINQIIVDIETAKAVVELPSPWAGKVSALLAAEGDTVDVGTPIIAVEVAGTAASGTSGETAAAPAPAPAPTPSDGQQDATQEPPARQAVLVGYGVKPGATTRRPRKAPSTRPASYPGTPSAQGGMGDGQSPHPGGHRGPGGWGAGSHPCGKSPPGGSRAALAKPPVRKLAKDLGVDLGALTGSGPEGSVTREDVQRAAGEATVRSGYKDAVTGAGPVIAAAPASAGPKSGSRSAECASTLRRQWWPARSPRRM